MREIKSCAILGHNPMRFAWGFDEEAAECHDMKMELAQQIMVLRQQGVTHFSVACDYGVGLYAAEIINALRNDDSELMLFCIECNRAQTIPGIRKLPGCRAAIRVPVVNLILCDGIPRNEDQAVRANVQFPAARIGYIAVGHRLAISGHDHLAINQLGYNAAFKRDLGIFLIPGQNGEVLEMVKLFFVPLAVQVTCSFNGVG